MIGVISRSDRNAVVADDVDWNLSPRLQCFRPLSFFSVLQVNQQLRDARPSYG